MMSITLAIIGTWILQDAVASIFFYPQEKFKWNHFVRLIRAVMGVILIVMAYVSYSA